MTIPPSPNTGFVIGRTACCGNGGGAPSMFSAGVLPLTVSAPPCRRGFSSRDTAAGAG